MTYRDTLVLQIGVPDYLLDAVGGVVSFLPRLIGALLILLIGWIIGRLLARVIFRIADRTDVDRLVIKTPLGGALGGTEKAVSRSLGRIGGYFVYALAILAAADALAIDLLSEWIASAVSYLPAFIAGVLIIIVGFVLADFLSDVVAHTESLTDTTYTETFADGLRVFLYFVVTVIGLGTMGVDVRILNTFAQAAAWGLAAGVALAVGIAFGLGGRDYVAANVGDWLPGHSPETATTSPPDTDTTDPPDTDATATSVGQTDGGEGSSK